jgi:hypothetical protein
MPLSFISKVEGGDHIPTIPVLKRILARCGLKRLPLWSRTAFSN